MSLTSTGTEEFTKFIVHGRLGRSIAIDTGGSPRIGHVDR